jgi:hypothetical protein
MKSDTYITAFKTIEDPTVENAKQTCGRSRLDEVGVNFISPNRVL